MSHHTPFKSLGPLSWPTDISPHLATTPSDNDNEKDNDPSGLSDLLTTTLANAQLLIDSIPTPTPPPPAVSASARPSTPPPGRARSHTDSGLSPSSFNAAAPATATATATAGGGNGEEEWRERREAVAKLGREWKDLKVQQGAKGGNPHNIAMYKMGAKDGRGAWFARAEEAALRAEMKATLERVEAAQGKVPGTGNIRGIGAERRVDSVEFEAGTMDVYHVSARFPGPTTPRDFVTLIMMPKEQKKGQGKSRTPRQFMVVSRPCEHPECPPRSGFIRGTYESVEVIREVPVEKPLRRVRSSIDLSRDELKGAQDGEHMSKEAVLRAAKQAVGEEAESEGEGRAVSFRLSDGSDGSTEMAVEWLMVTRSDPGGSVPRFMVEKGTPGGIINDAGRFLKWLSSQTMEDLTRPREAVAADHETKPTKELTARQEPKELPADASAEGHVPTGEAEYQEGPSASNSGIYGMLSSALGMASSAVASRVAAFAPASMETDDDDDISDSESDTSDASFASADEGSPPKDTPLNSNKTNAISAADNASTRSSAHSTLSEPTSQTLSREPTPSVGLSQAHAQHEKELGKLQQRMRKAQEKLERAQARRRAKNNNNGNGTTDPDTDTTTTTTAATKEAKEKEKDDQALAKLREKHERDMARQEDKYRRELQRLADKRAAEERKAEERRRKAAEREEKGNLAMELERARAERDVARKEAEMLRERVGELQGQNTRLVARLGREGVDVEGLKDVL